MDWLNDVKDLLSETMSHQFAQISFIFGLVAWIHSSRVRSEIAAQLGPIATAIKDLGSALRQDLTAQAERIGKVEQGVGQLNDRINRFEIKKKGEVI